MPVYKNRGIRTQRTNIIFACLLLMLLCLFLSRAALSCSIVLFLIVAIVHKNFAQQWKCFVADPFLLCFTFLFFIPFVSGLWSNDVSKWLDVVRLKLPLFFFPLAFAGNWQLSRQQWFVVTAVFIALVVGGCAWSLLDYAQHVEAIHSGYLKAKSLLTPLEDDHVRFSWMMSVAIMTCFLLQHLIQQRWYKILLLLVALFFIAYLFVLSARTGIISLGIFLLLYAGWYVFKKKQWKITVFLLAFTVALPVVAYFAVPTFQNRIQYIVYDFSFVQKQQYLPGANDGARTMSLRAGWHVLQQNPLGAGAGDVMHEADKWYAANVPQVLATDKFYPSSEWLLYGAFAGWPGVMLFTFVMLLPFFVKKLQYKIFWTALHATAAFSFAFDMGLEVQYGIFLYAFLTFWWWKWLGVRS